MLALLATSLLLSAPTGAERAQRLYEEARYDEALAALGSSCAQDDGQVRCEQLRAMALLGLGREAEARGAFERALVLAPGASLGPDVSPKVQTLWQATKKGLERVRALGLEPVVVPSADAPWPLAVKPGAEVALLSLRAYVEVDGEFKLVQLTHEGDAWVGMVQSRDADEASPRYYLLATLPSGVEVPVGSSTETATLALRVDSSAVTARDPVVTEPTTEYLVAPAKDDKILGLSPLAFWGIVGGSAAIITTVVLIIALTGDEAPGRLDVSVELVD